MGLRMPLPKNFSAYRLTFFRLQKKGLGREGTSRLFPRHQTHTTQTHNKNFQSLPPNGLSVHDTTPLPNMYK
jgi:hypothetical protein